MTTQQILSLIISLVLLAVLVTALLKKVTPAFALMACGILGLLYFTISTGSSVMEAQGYTTTGNIFFDLFAYLEKVFVNLLSNNILSLMAIMGCVSYFNHLKSTTLLCLILAQPLKKIKYPFLVVVMVVFITMILKFSIYSTVSQMALILATLYPIMMALGISKATAASTMLFASYVGWGPANFWFLLFSGMADTKISVTEYFMHFEFPATMVTMVLCLITFYFTSKYFDKKEGALAQKDTALSEYNGPKDLGLPYYYAIFPLLPVILVLVFSGGILPITITITTACITSWIIVFVIDILRRKDKIKAITETMEFWKGAGSMIATSGAMVISASVFAGTINVLGGLSSVFTVILQGGGTVQVLAIVGSLAAALFVFLTGSVNGCIMLFGPLMAQVANAAGGGFLQIVVTLIPLAQQPAACAIATTGGIFISGETGVPIITIIKRNALPLIVYIISQIIMTQFVLWPIFGVQ